MTADPQVSALPRVPLGKLFGVFFRIGLTSFGGGLVAYLKDEIVDNQKWIDDEEFLAALEIGQTLPGLNSTNVSIIVGRKLAGPWGSVVAAAGLVLPGAFLLAIIGFLYIRFQHNPDVKAALAGVTAAAVGLLLQVTLKIGKKQFLSLRDLAFIIPTFILVGIFHLSLLAALFLLAPLAIWLYRPRGIKTAAVPDSPVS
jgi:chromate transporter